MPPAGTDGAPVAIRQRIDRAVGRAMLALVWERLWPRLAPLLWLGVVFLILSWFGFWRLLPDLARYGVLAAFAAAAAVLLVFAARVRLPSAAEALARVERATGVPHRPATAVNDRLVSAPEDPRTQALWAAHRRRLLSAFGQLKAGIPSPGLPRRDPLALRFLLVLVAVIGFLFAGADRLPRIAEAFRIGEPIAEVVARVDAWVTPPAYTGRPPVFLTGVSARHGDGSLSLPINSVVTVRVGGRQDLAVSLRDASGESEVAAAETPARARAADREAVPPREYRVTLGEASEVTVRRGSEDVIAWQFMVEPDRLPEIALIDEPDAALTGALKLAYSLQDDYGVVGARAEFTPLAGTDGGDRRPLYEAPEMPLSLPQLRIRDGAGETTRDLTSHPWSGGKVMLTLIATDEAGQEGRSDPVEIALPQRRFADPLARALVEQRRELALDANQAEQVAAALDALTIAPDKNYGDDFGKYLAIRVAYSRTVNAMDDDALRSVVDLLWDIALGIEDGELSLSARDLRDAQQALREALERGATDEEIRRLTEALRQAMQQFLQALAQEAMRNPNMANIPPGAMQMLRPGDLDRLLDRIEELARTGAADAARQLLDQLQNMLENLQAGIPQMGDQQSGEMNQMMQELGDLIRRQQQLMDETHRAERGLSQNGQPGEPMTQEQLEQLMQQLQQGQGDLQQMLQDLMQQMEQMGMQPGGEFGQAGRSMGDAEGSLGQGQPGPAIGSQGDALDALRRGAQGMMQQFGNQPGNGFGGRRGGDITEVDPLGRPQRNEGPDFGTQVKVPDEIDTQRAREILDAIRERLADPTRPLPERNYLERLLGL